MTTDGIKIIILILMAIVAVIRWTRYFRAKKNNEEYKVRTWETIATFALVIAFFLLTILKR